MENLSPPRPTPRPTQPARADIVQVGRYLIPRHYLWQGKPLPAFWTIGAAASLLLNLVLIVALITIGRELFALKSVVNRQLLGGLYYNFVLMDQARIKSRVKVEQTIPIEFDLHLHTDTIAVLTQTTHIQGARVTLTTGGLNIVEAPTDIFLAAGTELPVTLDLTVPVQAMVPIKLTVPVDIPLSQTELHAPFVGLQQVVAPYYSVLAPLPDSWSDWFCRTPLGFFCR